ncbi:MULTISPECIES: hypothetical protein [Rhizorhabdus]|uniref:Uncharacterized protein n=2 Tax=Rhizorhabdus TaxID=1649486 RepID=A0A1T5BQ46_9SPHN|nr:MULTISPECIES: hypothetical protein [Rhizorhabdus]QTH19793.1 hypothetical protein HRJ34_15620 [Rhizorhabdus wittichii]SKB49070.1 hypothetical protein SAMN06295920_103173 [Rhizorhabdus histidinilytica]
MADAAIIGVDWEKHSFATFMSLKAEWNRRHGDGKSDPVASPGGHDRMRKAMAAQTRH